jgi:serine phosphatase RsbU (regulator of sigma subunit)
MSTQTVDRELAEELRNFQEIAAVLKPSSGTIPRLPGIDIHGTSIPFRGEVGGDHLIYIDFNKRYDLGRRIREAEKQGRNSVAARLSECRSRAGILLADVSGHRVTDGLIAAMLHQAFLLGASYELDRDGEITTKLFEYLNQRFCKSTSVNRYLTMIYGEVSVEGKFRFLSAGHPRPKVFSREFGRFVDIGEDRLISFPPVGMVPSLTDVDERADSTPLGYKRRYEVNEIDLLAEGDLLFLYTDGLLEHAGQGFFPRRVEEILVTSDGWSAKQICHRVQSELLATATPEDDISFVVVRRTSLSDTRRE